MTIQQDNKIDSTTQAYKATRSVLEPRGDTITNLDVFSNEDKGVRGHKSRGGVYDGTPIHNLGQFLEKRGHKGHFYKVVSL